MIHAIIWLLVVSCFPFILGVCGGISEYRSKRKVRKEVRNCLD